MESAIGETAQHWDAAYQRPPVTLSWYQEEASMSLRLIEAAGVSATDAVIDIGGGASTLVDGLVQRGFGDVTVLDLSPAGLQIARQRLADHAATVKWLVQDLLTWQPDHRYDLWHDRAVLHFLLDVEDRRRYVEHLCDAVAPGGHVIIATFAADGPPRCSGLPTARYAPEDLQALLGAAVDAVTTQREEHHTPSGAIQPFTWLLGRRRTT